MPYDIAKWHSLKPVIDSRLRARTMTIEQVEAFANMSPEALKVLFPQKLGHSHDEAVQIGGLHILMNPVPGRR